MQGYLRTFATLLSITLPCSTGCAATDSQTGVPVGPAPAPELRPPAHLQTLQPQTPCKILYGTHNTALDAESAKLETQINQQLSKHSGKVAVTLSLLSNATAGKTNNAHDQRRARPFINGIGVWPNTVFFSPHTLALNSNGEALVQWAASHPPQTFVGTQANAIGIARKSAPTSAQLLDACQAYGWSNKEGLQALWLVNFSTPTGATSVEIDDHTQHITATHPLQYSITH